MSYLFNFRICMMEYRHRTELQSFVTKFVHIHRNLIFDTISVNQHKTIHVHASEN